MKILFVHLLNNFTGSPRVLSNLLDKLSEDDTFECHLLTSYSKGALSDIDNVIYHHNYYNWRTNKIILALKLLFSQIYQFFFVLFSRNYNLLYINTILPFGAAFAAKIRKIRCVYHIHEYYPNPNLMQKICVFFAKKCASEVIFVSEYLRNCYVGKFTCSQTVIYNSVSQAFHERALQYNFSEDCIKRRFANRKIVMPCGLKKYKGIFEFIKLANCMPDFNFSLVISNPKTETALFLRDVIIPTNLTILNEIKDMASIYQDASLVMNMSLPHGNDIFIETFAMTLIEGFEYGVPCIAPSYGGPLEVVEDGKCGYLVEPLETDFVIEKIKYIFNSFDNYVYFAKNARERTGAFDLNNIYQNVKAIICVKTMEKLIK